MISTITPAMRAAEERPVHWSELEDAPDTCPADYEPVEHDCGGECQCDWYYDEDRDDWNDGVDDDLGLDPEDNYDADSDE